MSISCNICFASFTAGELFVVAGRCGHVFHSFCLEEWMNRTKNCPQCRRKITKATKFQIYLSFDTEPVVNEEDHSDLIRQNEELNSQTDKLTKEIDGKNSQIDELSNEISVKTAEIGILKEEVKQLEARREEVDENLKKANETIDELKSQLFEKESKLRDVGSQVVDLEQKLADLSLNEKYKLDRESSEQHSWEQQLNSYRWSEKEYQQMLRNATPTPDRLIKENESLKIKLWIHDRVLEKSFKDNNEIKAQLAHTNEKYLELAKNLDETAMKCRSILSELYKRGFSSPSSSSFHASPTNNLTQFAAIKTEQVDFDQLLQHVPVPIGFVPVKREAVDYSNQWVSGNPIKREAADDHVEYENSWACKSNKRKVIDKGLRYRNRYVYRNPKHQCPDYQQDKGAGRNYTRY